MTDYPHFKINLYDVTINVICCKDWEQKAKRILEKHNLTLELDNTEANALKLPGKDGYYAFFSPDADNKTIYHECIHLLIFIMDDCNLILDVDNSESIAYLGEYIIDNVMKIKNQKPRITKNPAKKGGKKK